MMEIRWYALDARGDPVRITNHEDIGKAFSDPRRIVAEDFVDDARVSTVFLVLDHGGLFSDDDEPILWETMIFGGVHDGWQERYTSRAYALEGHKTAVTLARSAGCHDE